jgi:hypothetical protein
MLIFDSKQFVTDVPTIPFGIDTGNHTDVPFFLSILTNSVHKCTITANISNSAGPVQSITAPNFYTGIVECHYAKQMYDIPHVFTLATGDYLLDISMSQPVSICEIHIKQYDPTCITDLGYQPIQTDNIPINDCSYNKYVIIPYISASFGGLWWCNYQALLGIHIAIENKLIPIIEYNGGLYGSNSIYDPPNLPNSWWNYFFEDPYPIHPDEKKRVLEHSRSNLRAIQLHRRFNTVLPINPAQCYHYYSRLFYQAIRVFKRVDKRDLLRKYIRPLPYINNYCQEFWQRNNPSNKPVIGIHYRGTDKYATSTASEGYPIHYSYTTVATIVRDKLRELNIDEYVLYCASDEEPFIEFMKSQFDSVVCNAHSIRSSVSTSGIKYNFDSIRFGQTTDQNHRSNYDYVKSLSLHFGCKDKSNFTKGFYAVTDCVLFKPCNVIFISQGNFSEFASFYTEPEAKVFKLNDLYQPYINELVLR